MVDKEYKRCSLCNYTDMDDTEKPRNFRLDKETNEYHCQQCVMSIEDVLIYYDDKEGVQHIPYWKREKRIPAADSRRQPKKDIRMMDLTELLENTGEISLIDQEVEEFNEEDENNS